MFKIEQIKFPIFAGTLYSLIIVFIGSLIASLLLAFTGVTEASLPKLVYIVNALALFIGGFVSGRRGQEKGWYYGGMTGIMYYVFLLLLGFLGFNSQLGMHNVYYLLLSFVISALGGIIGVNTTRK
ncbi:TIGR04086 family membrane protein [Aneurinibacillus tyrosinisolvens]|jgi:putative membrane protein (TIGR04086 family)|uniref:TIGR04086 family membrane protein n=1 Tax=Aneurinibacillus tyrosinisolvens TaxID=1443435 RepID=UPI00063ED9F9|nr:TIGR04086 family membrane protein [Aneurinibacillus tyrosinisolvens]